MRLVPFLLFFACLPAFAQKGQGLGQGGMPGLSPGFSPTMEVPPPPLPAASQLEPSADRDESGRREKQRPGLSGPGSSSSDWRGFGRQSADRRDEGGTPAGAGGQGSAGGASDRLDRTFHATPGRDGASSSDTFSALPERGGQATERLERGTDAAGLRDGAMAGQAGRGAGADALRTGLGDTGQSTRAGVPAVQGEAGGAQTGLPDPAGQGRGSGQEDKGNARAGLMQGGGSQGGGTQGGQVPLPGQSGRGDSRQQDGRTGTGQALMQGGSTQPGQRSTQPGSSTQPSSGGSAQSGPSKQTPPQTASSSPSSQGSTQGGGQNKGSGSDGKQSPAQAPEKEKSPGQEKAGGGGKGQSMPREDGGGDPNTGMARSRDRGTVPMLGRDAGRGGISDGRGGDGRGGGDGRSAPAQSVSQSLRGGTIVNPEEGRSGATGGVAPGIQQGGAAQINPQAPGN